ncbi:MAG TPA: amidohydrolase family protein [Thermomicrobiales bacterium]|nr:amidohydrolase family protein [Thermomicrobiales bacterium]
MTTPLIDVNCFIGRWPAADLAFHDAAGLLARMDRLGIGKAVVCHTWAWQYDPVAGNQQLMTELAALPLERRERLLPCWAVVPSATGEQGTTGELGVAMEGAGIRVARLFPRDHNYSLSSPDAAELLAMLAERRILTLIDFDQTSWEEIDRIAGQTPDLQLVVCRTGYRVLRRMAGVLARRPNCAIDLSYFGSHEGVEWLVDRFGAGRMLFGTAAPLADGGGAVTRLMLSAVSEGDRAAIGAGNAQRLLGIEQGANPSLPPDHPAAEVRQGEPIQGWDVIDAHGHVGPWFNFFTPNPDGETMLRIMDRCGVRMAVVSALLGVGPDAEPGNAEVVELIARHPARFAGYAVFNPHHPGSLADVERTLACPGIVGIKIHPDTHEYHVAEPGYAPMWELANARRLPVLTHTFAGSAYSEPVEFDSIARRWPEARIIMGHSGATPAGHRQAITVAQAHPNLYLELCGSFTTGQWIRRMVDAVGAERVLFGTDFPFIDFRYGLGRVVFADLSESERRLVLGENARRLLKLPLD